MISTSIELLTPQQVAPYLKISVRSVYRLLDEGEIPYYSPTPRKKLIDKVDVFNYLEATKNR